ncbi:hypothetical protein CCP3SC1AL1_520008 [Gammaproteobacteria bacterium]
MEIQEDKSKMKNKTSALKLMGKIGLMIGLIILFFLVICFVILMFFDFGMMVHSAIQIEMIEHQAKEFMPSYIHFDKTIMNETDGNTVIHIENLTVEWKK